MKTKEQLELLASQKRAYRLQNKEKISEQDKKSKEKNKDKITERRAKKYQEDKKTIAKRSQTPEALKSKMIRRWKYNGVKYYDFDKLHDNFIRTDNCEVCNIEFIERIKGVKGNKGPVKCLDHCHRTGYFRHMLCNKCNTKRPIYERLHVEVLLELHRYFKLCNI